jgi:hypothetical protein
MRDPRPRDVSPGGIGEQGMSKEPGAPELRFDSAFTDGPHLGSTP